MESFSILQQCFSHLGKFNCVNSCHIFRISASFGPHHRDYAVTFSCMDSGPMIEKPHFWTTEPRYKASGFGMPPPRGSFFQLMSLYENKIGHFQSFQANLYDIYDWLLKIYILSLKRLERPISSIWRRRSCRRCAGRESGAVRSLFSSPGPRLPWPP